MNKPDSRIIKRACKQMKIDPEECIYIGDGSNAELREHGSRDAPGVDSG